MRIACLVVLLVAPFIEAGEIPRDSIVGLSRKKLRVLEPDLLIYRDTPELIAKYSTPEGEVELRRIAEKAEKESLVLKVEQAMHKLKPQDAMTALPGFVVNGQGRDALPGVLKVIAAGKPPVSRFTKGQPLTVVFFSHLAPTRLRFDKADQSGNKITLTFSCFEGDHTTFRPFIALIPLSGLSAGRYDVFHDPNRLPAKGLADDVTVMKYVSRPFSFQVVDASKE